MRRAWDSNPRWELPIAVFKTAALGHYATTTGWPAVSHEPARSAAGEVLRQAVGHAGPCGGVAVRLVLVAVVVLGDGHAGPRAVGLEGVDEGVVVLGTVLLPAQRAEVRHFQPVRLVDGDHLALVLVGRA